MLFLSFQSRVYSLQGMLGAPKLGRTLLGSMQRFWALFPWRWTLLKNNPQCPQNANNSHIFGHTGAISPGGGPPGMKNYFFHVPIDLMCFQKKGGINIIIFWGKVFITPIKLSEGGDLK